jgi:hypothetical protein
MNPPSVILPISNLAKVAANYFAIDEDGVPGTQWVVIPAVSGFQAVVLKRPAEKKKGLHLSCALPI